MPQVSLYADDALMSVLRERSARENVSMSKFVGNLVKDQVMGKSDNWPTGYWDDLYGCLADASPSEAPGDTCLDPQLDDACDWFEEA